MRGAAGDHPDHAYDDHQQDAGHDELRAQQEGVHDRGEQQASPNELMATLQDIQRRLARLEEVIGSAK